MRVNVEGDDAGGYRVQLRTTGETQTFYVVKVDGAYRILTVAPLVGPVALMALERVEAGDFAGARRWLDWARLELRPANSEDPLDGPELRARLDRGRGDGSGRGTRRHRDVVSRLRLGGARPTAAGRGRAGADPSAADKLSLDLALAQAYLDLERWAELREVGHATGGRRADFGAGGSATSSGR